MQDRPTASELLSSIADLLEKQVLGATQGSLRHSVRVAGNLCRILEHKTEAGADLERREVELLAEVLGESPADRDALTLSRTLAERLDAADDRALEKRAHAALARIVRGKLSIAKPGHDAYDFSAELD
jgi:hypothetical protein